ncbi:hypothetical protein [Sulfitobacter geojensis]|uniref:hypothetical protein n=1 Tax=Sulfitobacter geojensis TaxID=1342299 RepID=UPI00046948B3|nr:hypothetical protein [Sulfitobacter geojensis]KHA53788.1 hypothetical protein Z947_4108 [Sulfitobacter geojensis]NYI27574.1 hypothetical protein [Sulfitobacter geojensis]
MASKLAGSVGRKGKNAPDDVKTVQTLLNGFASKLKTAKLKPDGAPSPKLEQLIGTFQSEICGFKPDFRIDPGKGTIKKLMGGPAKAESEHKAAVKKVKKDLLSDRDKVMAKLIKEAEAIAKAKGMPQTAARVLYNGVEQSVMGAWDSAVDAVEDVTKTGKSEITKIADQVSKQAVGEIQKAAGKMVSVQVSVVSALLGAAKKAAKTKQLSGKAAQELYDGMEQYASDQWAWLTGGETAEEAAKKQEKLAREATKTIDEVVKKIDPGECLPEDKTPLVLSGSEVAKVNSPCFAFTVKGKSDDPKSQVLLCLDKKDNHIDITKGYGKSSVVPLFKLIDDKKLWGKTVKFFAMETTDGKPDDKSKSNVVELQTPVEPFKGTISYTGLGGAAGLKYTGNGHGRLLSYTKINGWYFFKHGGKYERDPAMRGFDCITYVGTANKVSSGMDGRGDKLANKLGASQVEMENKSKADIIAFFNGDGKTGKYIGWWSTHCFVIINGTVHDWSPNTNGYRTTKAASFGWKNAGNYVRKL